MKWLLVILSVLIVAACGGNDATDTADEPPTAATPTTTAAATETVAAVVETTTTTKAAEATTTTEAAPVVSDEQAATIAAYQTTWNDGDEDAFRALFAPGAALEDPENFTRSGDVDWIVEQSAGRLLAEISLSIYDCVLSGEEAVTCTAEFAGAVPIAMNFVPWRDTYVFSFEDELITHISQTCVICWDGDAEDRFGAWIKTVDEPQSTENYGYILLGTEEKAAYWLEWAPKWQEAGRP